ncbi:hypothetical protein CGQ24_07475 [Arthrobacter sp. 7749]|nr:hypothetical protein CGQ24_07475 [Arthrobacter sp. 7749]
MQTPIERIIDDATDEDTNLASLLLKVKVMARRLQATELSEWVSNELDGYSDDMPVPKYRVFDQLNVIGTWEGYGGHRLKGQRITSTGLSEERRKAWFSATLRQSLTEIEEYSKAENDVGIPWDPYTVMAYEQCVMDKEGGASIESMTLNNVNIMISRQQLRALLNKVRSTVIDLAMDLESIDKSAGQPDGPTVSNEGVASVVNNFHIQVTGDGNNVAAGSGNKQRTKVVKNDVASLIAAAKELGLSDAAASEFKEAVLADGKPGGTRAQNIIERVSTGALALAGSITADVAASGLIEAVNAYFGAA